MDCEMAREISNSDDVIDSRDIIARIEELEELQQAVADAKDELDEANQASDELQDGDTESNREKVEEAIADAWEALESAKSEFDEDVQEELKTLLALQEECNWGDWSYGTTLIRDSYFQDYAQELAEDIGAINKDASWPNNCIDWEQATRELQMDYTSVDFDGVTYWLRS